MIQAKKTLSQNFLHDTSIRDKILEAVSPSPEKSILEIGPGLGKMTEPLSKMCQLTAVEKDRRLIAHLSHLPIKLLNQDILTISLEGSFYDTIVSNIPYNITSPLLRKLQNEKQSFAKAILMVQKEVAEALSSPYAKRAFFAEMQLSFSIRLLFIVPKTAFRPIPKVDSAVIELIPRKKTYAQNVFSLVQTLFRHPRKMIGSTLKKYSLELGSLQSLEKKRPSEVPTEELASKLDSYDRRVHTAKLGKKKCSR